MKSVYLIDTTLRDGEQAPCVSFTTAEKIAIAQKLDEIGIPELEIACPAMGDDEVESLKTIVNQGFDFRISTWCRAKKEDIDAARKTKVMGVNISFPVSDIHLSAMERDWKWVLKNMKTMVSYAQEHFGYVSLGAQDASRASESRLMEYLSVAADLKTHRVRIADTIGILNPLSTFQLIDKLKKQFPNLNLEFHAHNDLGMATANTISAVQAGIDSVSLTVNGLGERAGNAALEEVVMALKYSTDYQTHINTTKINDLCQLVAAVSGRPIAESKAIVGEMALKHESGIHTKSILKNKRTYQLFDAENIGKTESEFVFGKHSGTAALMHYFTNKAIDITKTEACRMLEKIKEFAAQHKRNVTAQELEYFYFAKA